VLLLLVLFLGLATFGWEEDEEVTGEITLPVEVVFTVVVVEFFPVDCCFC